MGTILGGNLAAQQMGGMPGDWAQLTPEQKREWRLNNFLNPRNLQFVSEKAKESYRVRAQRLVDVYNVEEPDRVPVTLPVGNFPYTNYGINYRTAMYDYDKAIAACKKFNEEFSEELEYWASPWVTPGRVLELLDYRLYAWPGHRLGENVFCELAKTCNAHSRVDHQVAVASTHMPDVAAKKRHDMRLEDESDVVIDPTKLKPSFGDLEHSSLCVSGAGGSKRPIDRGSLE
jgi:hypothetical protein